jgi:outer membrane protein assembly factor BamA
MPCADVGGGMAYGLHRTATSARRPVRLVVTVAHEKRDMARGLKLLVLVAAAGLALTGCARPRIAELYPELERHAGRRVDDVAYRNTEPFSRDSLRAITESRPTRCRLVPIIFPFCVPGTDWGLRLRLLDLESVGRDVTRLTALYRQSGYFGSTVIPEVEELPRADGVRLTFHVQRGPPIHLDTLIVEGTEGVAEPDSVAAGLRLQPGDMFELPEFLAASDEVAEMLRERGHPFAEVLRSYSVDLDEETATAWLTAIPGPQVTVDSVVLVGADVLDRETIRRHLVIREGQLLRLERLRQSQRNLYDLELIQFASVGVAPDTLQARPEDEGTATVLVQINEADEYLVEALAAFGTQDCVRLGAQWVDRSFIRGGRRLTLSGTVSRIASGLCEPRDTLFGRAVDYRFSAELLQPYFVTPRNQLSMQGFAERVTQPGLFRRTAQGGRLALSHRLGARENLSAALDLEYRETDAVPVLYCYAFAVCTPEDIIALGRPHWRNALAANWYRDRGDRPVSPSRGYNVRTTLVWSSPLLASDYDFVRASGESSVYRPIARGWTFAANLRLGSFLTRAGLGLEDFIPPEERFYAGGANSVRGYARNQLGPGVWLYEGSSPPDTIHGSLPVQFFPTGGMSVVVANAELRFPAPILAERAGLVLFADAGMIGIEPLWSTRSPWRVTPGGGLRVETPVGPARIDLAYNPNPQPRGPLLVPEAEGLRRIADGYRPAPPGFWQRLQLHVAVGQAF